MRNAKNGQWWLDNNHFSLANNSAAYTEKPDIEIFLKEWLSLIESKSGERGIFNRVSATKKAESNGRRKVEGFPLGTNPCIAGESLLQVRLDGKDEIICIDNLVSIFNKFENVEIKTLKNNNDIYSKITSASLTKKNANLLEIIDEESGKSIKCTPDHLILTKNRGWVAAQNLLQNDVLFIS